MAYGDFDYDRALQALNLTAGPARNLFASVPLVEPSPWFKTVMEWSRLAHASNTEKARSEMLITPFFMELWSRYRQQCFVFSGVEFNVDPAQELRGYCDFILTRSPLSDVITAPVVMITEAKNNDLASGRGQCIAEMVAARIFNERQKNTIPIIYGVVSNGDMWQFMQLEKTTLTTDSELYYRSEAAKILGILVHLIS